MRIIGVIQARMSSTRLPGKILAPLAGQPLLEVVVERVRGAAVDEWWLATTDRADDDVVEEWGRSIGIDVHRGPDEDVLARFAGLIRRRSPDVIVRLTADNPFVNAEVINLLVNEYRGKADGIRVVCAQDGFLPLGFAPQVADAAAVSELDDRLPASDAADRAHVLSRFYSEARVHRAVPPRDWPVRPGWRWTVDTHDDLRMATQAFACFGDRWSTLTYTGMVGLLDQRPDITARNAAVKQRALEEG